MKFLRVGTRGSEQAVVMDANGSTFALPDSLSDLDGSFWTSGGVAKVQKLHEANELTALDITGMRLGAPIARPGKVVCIGLNYRDHAKETGLPIPEEPIIFLKGSDCVIGPDDEILIPRGSKKTDWEVELGVVIGSTARYLESPDESPSVIAGYVLSNDVSEREFQMERGGQWDKGKCCETFNPLGPWVVTPDEVSDPQNLTMNLQVNGETRQDGNTKNMIFGVNHILWYLSQFMVLEPGDLVNTGTPAGVSAGNDSIPFLAKGDVTTLSIEGLGTQTNAIGQA